MTELTEGDLDFDDPLTGRIMGAAWLHTHDHTMAYAITREVLAVVRVQPEPVAWRWQVYGIWHYAGGWPVSGAEPLYLRPSLSDTTTEK